MNVTIISNTSMKMNEWEEESKRSDLVSRETIANY